MALSVGEKIPQSNFYTMGEEGPGQRTSDDLFSGKKVVLIGVPGAFTPTCHNNHLPGFVEHAEAIKAKGIDEIAVVSCNDVFVMDAWVSISGGEGKVSALADPDAAFAKSIGTELDLTARGLGVRSKRYAMIVEDGTVTTFNVEEGPGAPEGSSAEHILGLL